MSWEVGGKMTEPVYDVAVIGCGPAGLSAALNAAVRRKKVILFGGEFCVSKVNRSPRVDNFLGRPGVTGEALHREFVAHVREFNIPMVNKRVINVFPDEDGLFGLAIKDRIHRARTVILAVGMAVARTLEGEEVLIGRGVSYCATCDGPLFQGKTVAIIDYTREGIEEAVYMAGFCTRVYYVCMHTEPPRFEQENIELLKGMKPVRILGADGTVSALELDKRTVEVEGVFVFREAFPPQDLVPGLELEGNHIKVGRGMETSIPGIFAAGDCTGKPYQLGKSVGEGQVAALHAVAYLDAAGK